MSPTSRYYSVEPSVHFSNPACTAYIYPLNHPEYWAIRYFEDHVGHCEECVAPYERLCRVGLGHAGSIDSYMYSVGNHVKSSSNERLCLEIPTEFRAVRVLLQTLQFIFPKVVPKSDPIGVFGSHHTYASNKSGSYGRRTKKSGGSNGPGGRASKQQHPKIRYVYYR